MYTKVVDCLQVDSGVKLENYSRFLGLNNQVVLKHLILLHIIL